MKIVIVRLSAIGDCCLVLPVVKAILAQIPTAEVDWIIGHGAYSLIKNYSHPRLKYYVIDKPKNVKDYFNIKKHFKGIEFDYLLAMQASTRANLIYPMIKAKNKIGFDFKRARELQWLFTNKRIEFAKEHLHDSFCRFANELKVSTKNLDWDIGIKDELKPLVLEKFQIPSPYIVVNPAASKLERSWSEQNYANLIEWLSKEYQVEVILSGSTAEFELAMAARIEALSNMPVRNLVGLTNLTELAAILEQAELLVAPDTGPAHIANAVTTPVVGLYAVAPSWLSSPYHYQHLVIDKFLMAAKTISGKNVENLKWNTRVHQRAAMDLIDLKEVKEIIRKILFID